MPPHKNFNEQFSRQAVVKKRVCHFSLVSIQ